MVTDATRIEKIVPTVEDLIARGAKVVLLAHFGRPKGKVVPEMSLRLVLPALEKALGRQGDLHGADRHGPRLTRLPQNAVVLVENTRFAAGEEANDPKMAEFLASLGDVYCNDAFSAAHRAHASTEGVAQLLPSFAGRLDGGGVGGAGGGPGQARAAGGGGGGRGQGFDQAGFAGQSGEPVDHLVIGGGMANTFLVAQGVEVGKSLAERDMAATALEILAKAKAAGCRIHLPVDVVVAREFKAGAENETVAVSACPADAMILDAGPTDGGRGVQGLCRLQDADLERAFGGV